MGDNVIKVQAEDLTMAREKVGASYHIGMVWPAVEESLWDVYFKYVYLIYKDGLQSNYVVVIESNEEFNSLHG